MYSFDYKNALRITLEFDSIDKLGDILEKYADTKQRNMDVHVRKNPNNFKKEVLEHICYEIEEIIENEDDDRVITLNDYLSVEFEIKEQHGNLYTCEVKVHEFDSNAVFGDVY